MRALLLNVGFYNKGNEAIVTSTEKIIQQYRSDIELIRMGSDNDIKHRILAKPATNAMTPHPWLYILKCCGIRALRQLGIDIKISKKSKLYPYDAADLVINSGGDMLSGEKFVISAFLNILYALILDKPVILVGESLGHYKNPINKMISKSIFERVELILVRENLSREYLLNLGIDAKKVYVTADPAFILPPAPISRIEEILKIENIPHFSNTVVGVNPSSLISNYLKDAETAEEHYIKTMVDAIDHLTETQEADVILIPHVYQQRNDDREVVKRIMAEISNPKKVFQVKGEYSAAELKGLIGLCDIFIGARMHATIAATSLCIPTIGIAYSHKMHGIIGKALDLEQYVIDINTLDSDVLKTTIDTVWSNRVAIKQHLKNVVPQVKEKSLLNGYYLAEYLESYFPATKFPV